MKKIGNILWGLIFITLGIIWGLNSTGITNINVFFRGWWTLIIIVPNLIGLFKSNNKTGNIIGLLIGIALLLCVQDIISFNIIRKLILPVILIIIGCSIIFRDRINNKINEKIKRLNKDGLADYVAVFSGHDAKFQNQEFKGANAEAIFGGVELDLREAIVNGEQIINATAIFGGIDIFVPSNVKVEVKSIPIFGGVSNNSINSKEENAPTIYINAFCLFGGVEIK